MNFQLIEAFYFAHNNHLKIQVLSLIPTTFKYETIKAAIPEVTDYLIKIARKHAFTAGPGALVEKKPTFRNKLNQHQLDYFLEFFTGEDFLHDVAHGNRVLKTAMGNNVIPDVVRTCTNSRIIDLYQKNCVEESIAPLSKS